jgi:hypothetical protein
MTDRTHIIVNPSPEYRRWKNQPCRIVNIMLPERDDTFSPCGYIDIILTGHLDPGLRLRIRANAVKQVVTP